jgi:hypothetical protein
MSIGKYYDTKYTLYAVQEIYGGGGIKSNSYEISQSYSRADQIIGQ